MEINPPSDLDLVSSGTTTVAMAPPRWSLSRGRHRAILAMSGQMLCNARVAVAVGGQKLGLVLDNSAASEPWGRRKTL